MPLGARSVGPWSFVPAQLPTPDLSFQRTVFYLEHARYVIFLWGFRTRCRYHTSHEASDRSMCPPRAVRPWLRSHCVRLRRRWRRMEPLSFTYSVNFYIKYVRANRSQGCQLWGIPCNFPLLPALYIFSLTTSASRGPGVPGWLHEHSLGADGGICKWTTEE